MSSFAHSEHRRRPLYLTSGNGFENSMAYCFGSQLGNISPKIRNIKFTKNEEKRTQKELGVGYAAFSATKSILSENSYRLYVRNVFCAIFCTCVRSEYLEFNAVANSIIP